MKKNAFLLHFSHFNICWGLDILFRHHEIFCAVVFFVTHTYLFKPDHGHHHFSYLSCFSETSKPTPHIEMSHCTEQSCRQKQTRFTTADLRTDTDICDCWPTVFMLYLRDAKHTLDEQVELQPNGNVHWHSSLL